MTSDQGYILTHRSLQYHWLWRKRPFSNGQAWIDLLMSAAWKTIKTGPNEGIKRGEYRTTERFLAAKWGWSRDRLRRFISHLETDAMVSVKRDHRRTTGGTTITIAKYDEYQTNELLKTRPQNNHNSTYKKQGNKVKNKTTTTGGIRFDLETVSWKGIEEKHRKAWGKAYPDVNIERELACAAAWVMANPKKGCKKNYQRFLTGWLKRSGGSNGNTVPDPARIPAATGKYARFNEPTPEGSSESRPEPRKRAPVGKGGYGSG